MKHKDRLKKIFEKYGNDNNHLPLLFLALEATDGDVYELGMGHGSTPYLFEYAIRNKKLLTCYETNREWMEKFNDLEYTGFKRNLISPLSWDIVVDEILEDNKKPAVLLLDHAPGETRGDVLDQLQPFKGVIVAHDTELGQADSGYGMRQHFHKYKYVKDLHDPSQQGACATALSNTIDVTKWEL